MSPERHGNRTVRWLAACVLLTPIIDVSITAWLGALDPDYSHVRQFISELGEAGRPYAAVFSAWCILWGILFAGFAVTLARGLDRQKYSWAGAGALFIVAASSIVGGLFPCDPGGTAHTVSGKVHLFVSGWIGTSGIVLAPFLTWVGMRRNETWRGYRTLSLVASAVLAALAAWIAVCHYGGVDRIACAMGLAQRLFIGTFYVWVGVVAIGLCSPGGTERVAV